MSKTASACMNPGWSSRIATEMQMKLQLQFQILFTQMNFNSQFLQSNKNSRINPAGVFDVAQIAHIVIIFLLLQIKRYKTQILRFLQRRSFIFLKLVIQSDSSNSSISRFYSRLVSTTI